MRYKDELVNMYNSGNISLASMVDKMLMEGASDYDPEYKEDVNCEQQESEL